MALDNPQHQLFVDKYIELGFNATRAAMAAKYSRKTARQQASRLLTNVDIKAAIEQRLGELTMGRNEVLARLADHARGDMRDFIGLSTNQLKKHPNGNLIKKVKRTVTTTAKDDKVETEEKIELELYDAQTALVQLGRHHGLFLDKTDLTSNGEKITTPTVFLPVVEPDE